MYDVVIIGAGVSGVCIARELSKYNVKVCVLEKNEDVCTETSKANSGIVHSGYDAKEGSLKAKLNVLGNDMIKTLSKELDFPYKNVGSFVLCTDEKDIHKLYELLERGKKNNVKGLSILTRDEILKKEPNINDNVVAGLYAETAGIVCPFSLNIAVAENAFVNGVDFKFNTTVLGFTKNDNLWSVKTSVEDIKCKYVVNAAGVYADVLHNMVSDKKIKITPRKGEYLLLDKSTNGFVNSVIFSLPNEYGKGVLLAPTTHNNIIVGPTAKDINDKNGVNTTTAGLDELFLKCNRNLKNVPLKSVITSFAGLRAHEEHGEFIIEEVSDAKGFIDCAGICSPGLTSCFAIGVMVVDIIKQKQKLVSKNNFIRYRKAIKSIKNLSTGEFNELIKKDSNYGNVVCRCETVTEGEILDAIRRPLGATTVDGVKRRTRMGFGRCQAGFCTPKVLDILSKELKTDVVNIKKSSSNSNYLIGMNNIEKVHSYE